MLEGELVNTHIKATENTTLAKLSIVDQLKLLITKFSNDDAAELDAAEKLSSKSLQMKASLQNLFNKAVTVMHEKNTDSVTIKVSSKYLPYMDDIIGERGMGKYYAFEIAKRDLPISIDYMFFVTIKRKVTR